MAMAESMDVRKPPVGENVTTRLKKKPAISSTPGTDSVGVISQDDIRNIVRSEMRDFINEMKDTISGVLNKELKSIKDEMKEVKDSMNFISMQYETLEKKQSSISEVTKSLQRENGTLQSTINALSFRVNQIEQHSRKCNLEIQCLPELKSENLFSTIKKIGTVIGCNVEQNYIVSCTRTPKLNPANTRPKSVVAQFSTPELRDTFLAATITYNKKHPNDKLNTSHLGMTTDKKPIYITEHLSAANKALHAAARTMAKEKGYSFVWIRNGRIFVRKNENSPFLLIKSIESLDKIV